MKTNLKTFPNLRSLNEAEYRRWHEDFKAELRERLKKLEEIKIGRDLVLCEIDFISEILGNEE